MFSDSVPAEAQEAIDSEIKRLESVIVSIQSQEHIRRERLAKEAERSRSLTQTLLAAKKDTDVQLLSSEESVSRSLCQQMEEELKRLEKLQLRPYFGRMVLDEDEADKTVRREFLLGAISNSDCRIVDWRKAPLAKLYYEYKEGEYFSELIQGRERNGKIVTRNSVEIEDGKLVGLNCHLGTFRCEAGRWTAVSSKGFSGARKYHQLPDVLSLISAEQFESITREPDTALLIQGVAGSGKTTVSVHRLSWLLGGGCPGLEASECLFLVKSPGLRTYVENTLHAAGLKLAILTYSDWLMYGLRNVFPELSARSKTSHANTSALENPTLVRGKQSLGILHLLNRTNPPASRSLESLGAWILGAMRNTAEVLLQDDTGILDREVLLLAADSFESAIRERSIGPDDGTLLLWALQKISGGIPRKDGRFKRFSHITVDEVQDYAATELALIVSSVEKTSHLTLVGDTEQATLSQGSFPGWERLSKNWEGSEKLPELIKLSVSHRSTKEIMRLANWIQKSNAESSGRPGKPPLWFKCRHENQGVSEALAWLSRVTEKFPQSVVAVLCTSDYEAEHVYSLLKPTFSHTVGLAADGLAEGIVVATITEVKGLEFPHVCIWNPSASKYPESVRGRNELYIACTRAEENLCLVTWEKPSPLLPSVNSALFRGYDRTIEEVEKEQDDDENYEANQ